MSEAKPVRISGTIMWAQLTKENEMSGKFQFDLCSLSDKAVEALEERGIKVRNNDDKGNFLTYKSKHPIKAYDKDGNEITKPIGNGSKAEVVTKGFEWTFKNKKGTSPSCLKLVIKELVVFNPDGDADNPDEDDVRPKVYGKFDDSLDDIAL